MTDVWIEPLARLGAVHPKPVGLQSALIEAVTDPGDVVLDPAAGSYSTLTAAQRWAGGLWVATSPTRPDGDNRHAVTLPRVGSPLVENAGRLYLVMVITGRRHSPSMPNSAMTSGVA